MLTYKNNDTNTYNYTKCNKTHQYLTSRITTAKHRILEIIDDDVDGNMDSSLEEPLKAKLKREPSRQGA